MEEAINMRDIKFRVLDKETGKLTSDITPRDFTNPELQQQLDKGVIELQQFTGLLDRHGKEIYEGDILRYEPHMVVPEYMKDYHKRVVEWSNSTGAFKIRKIGTHYSDQERNQSDWIRPHKLARLEVIGNVYENPELINGDKTKGDK